MMDLKTYLLINQHLIHQNEKKSNGTDYILSWKSQRLYTSELKPLDTTFLLSKKLSGDKIGTKFDKDPFAV